ncbi:MarR family winged helix-turn-helix transcriptional regulator [Desertibaculum subflavum]|uniref:MarR family winged helix-turn-helix transcriptional regulator n=1 Tax=Desertibaculum subflavum TaxID=2268458 RepID=UPI000E6698DA
MKPNQAAAAPTTDDDAAPLQLERFLPYRLAVLTNLVSSKLAAAYARQFNLTVAEWRIIAIVGRFPNTTASEIAERGALDKVAVSRAIASLVATGRLVRVIDPADRRRARLAMSTAGYNVYRKIVPLARDYERQLLATLAPEDLQALDRLLESLTARVRQLP